MNTEHREAYLIAKSEEVAKDADEMADAIVRFPEEGEEFIFHVAEAMKYCTGDAEFFDNMAQAGEVWDRLSIKQAEHLIKRFGYPFEDEGAQIY